MVNHSIRRDHFTERSTILQWNSFCRTAPTGITEVSAHSLLSAGCCCAQTSDAAFGFARSGRVAQVPFSSACFWRGLHYCRTTSSVWVGLSRNSYSRFASPTFVEWDPTTSTDADANQPPVEMILNSSELRLRASSSWICFRQSSRRLHGQASAHEGRLRQLQGMGPITVLTAVCG